MQENVEPRIRIMRIIWVSMLLNIGFFYALTFFVIRPEDVEPNSTLFLVFVVIALSTTLVSFLIKSKLLTQAVEQQHVQLVQQAYVVAWALSEISALLGLLNFFLTSNRYYYVLFLIAALGMLLHLPQREHVINASFKKPIL